MRKILFMVLTLLAVSPAAYSKDKEPDYKVVVVKNETTGDYSYEQVVQVENVSKEMMFARAKKWIIANIKTGDNNVQYDSTDMSITNAGNVVLKPVSGFGWVITSGFVNFKMNILFKDGRYKFVFDNIVVQAVYSDGTVVTVTYDQIQKKNKAATLLKKDINEKLLAITTQLEEAIRSGNASAKDNW